MDIHARIIAALIFGVLSAVVCLAQKATPGLAPPGGSESTRLRALEAGSQVLQTQSPPAQFRAYLVGLHPMKSHPGMQMEAHHFCRQVNEEFAQCVLFDGNTAAANLNGIEFIISARLYEQLPAAEKQYWHPHNYEILSGQLVAPGLPEVAEKEFLKTKINSYGKTWHVWNTGHFGMSDADPLPFGEPQLAWSFNHDGEAAAGSIERMQQRVGVDVAKKRAARRDLAPLAKPQQGTDALAGERERGSSGR